MRAVRSTGNGVEVVDVADPEGPGEMVEIRSASICGSDFGFIQGGSRFVLGHELAGVTAAGRPVAVEGIFGCGRCDQCEVGAYNRCRTIGDRVPGLTMDGGMSERWAAPAAALAPLPEGLDPADGSLVETAAVSWHAARIGGVAAGHRVGVVGGGSIGLLSVAAAFAHGAEEVGLVARYAHQTEAGERLGARPVKGEYHVVLVAASSESALATAVGLAAPGGTVVVLGVYPGVMPVPFLPAFLKEVRVVGSMAYCRHSGGRDIDQAAAMLAADPEIAATLISHRFPIEDAAEAFRVAADRSSGAIKVVVQP